MTGVNTMGNFETRLTEACDRGEEIAEAVGKALVKGFHQLALFAIGGAIVWSAVNAFRGMVEQGHATIEDILLLFIYLELGAMVGIYFYTRHMPVRFLIYVAITALTRMLIGFINVQHTPDEGILLISGAIVLLSFGVLVLALGPPSTRPNRQETRRPSSRRKRRYNRLAALAFPPIKLRR